jgi:rare lipoprotein A
MRKLVMGCAVAGLIALSPNSEAKLPASVGLLPLAIPRELPREKDKHPSEIGLASWYGEECRGNETASGELFDFNGLTAAHRKLPFGTIIKIINLRNKKFLQLRVNDRGPGIEGRTVDVTREAAKRLGFVGAGVAPVRVEIVAYPEWYLRRTAQVN